MAVFLLIAAVVGLPVALLLYNDYGSKRGCGRGCATCGNRDICFRTSGRRGRGSAGKKEQ